MISRKTTVSAAALLLASAGAAAAFPATAVTDLNVRSGPGTGFSVVDQLEAGETVDVVARSGGWYQLADGGWASGAFLDPEGVASIGYDVGPVAFYYADDPFYWDDAGFYFFIRDGRRHRVGWDWFDRHDHRHFRWADRRFRGEFERRRGDRSARRGDGPRDGDRPGIQGDGDGNRALRREGGRMEEGRSSVEDGALRTGRSSAIETEGGRRGGPMGRGQGGRIEGGGGGELRAAPRGEGRSGGGGGGGQRLEDNIPGGGY